MQDRMWGDPDYQVGDPDAARRANAEYAAKVAADMESGRTEGAQQRIDAAHAKNARREARWARRPAAGR